MDMNKNTGALTDEQLRLAEEIIRFSLGEAYRKFSYLGETLFMLEPMATNQIESIGANLKYLFYNPVVIARNYKENSQKIISSVIHCVLHCLYLHPVTTNPYPDLFSAAADMAVFIMMNRERLLPSKLARKVRGFEIDHGVEMTEDIIKAALADKKVAEEIMSIAQIARIDDHNAWRAVEKTELAICIPVGEEAVGSFDGGAASSEMKLLSDKWKRQCADMEKKYGSREYGNMSGGMFARRLEKPDRFSPFSYREYLKRFISGEIIEEDPDTLDMMMYTMGMELYDDIPIVEFSETREYGTVSDIIIAMDMSGSCCDETAEDFLVQLYTMFSQMELRGRVNIHVVTFDTEILNTTIIKSENDAKRLVENYELEGCGGTDFRCVFDYADRFSEMSSGRKLKGLFFFSDACGEFPKEKRNYTTAFFVPSDEEGEYRNFYYYDDVPEWIDLVKYN